jgi:hypothetical protein
LPVKKIFVDDHEDVNMRTASGVILILVAIIFFFGSLGYLLGGVVVTGVSQLDPKAIEQTIEEEANEVEQAIEDEGNELPEAVDSSVQEEGDEPPETVEPSAQEEEGDELTPEDMKELQATGVGLLGFGIFLLVSACILIAGAVFLFQGRKPGFIYAAGLLAILGSVIASFITGFGVVKMFEIVGGVMAIISARMISQAAQTPTEETPPPAV